jgi:hypothetical protein
MAPRNDEWLKVRYFTPCFGEPAFGKKHEKKEIARNVVILIMQVLIKAAFPRHFSDGALQNDRLLQR